MIYSTIANGRRVDTSAVQSGAGFELKESHMYGTIIPFMLLASPAPAHDVKDASYISVGPAPIVFFGFALLVLAAAMGGLAQTRTETDPTDLAQYCDPRQQSDSPDAPKIYCLDEHGFPPPAQFVPTSFAVFWVQRVPYGVSSVAVTQ
jgi:hypothetical protein